MVDGSRIRRTSREGRRCARVFCIARCGRGKVANLQQRRNISRLVAERPGAALPSGDQIMIVGYTASGDSFLPEKPRVWSKNIANATGFDFAPDGKRGNH